MQSAKLARGQKVYESPVLTKLAPDQAKEFLFNHASRGDLAAREMLELVLRANEYPKEHPK